MRYVYLPIADVAAIYDNSDEARILIAEREPGFPIMVHDAVRWAMIERASQ
jgi:predicted ABC-type ATPase